MARTLLFCESLEEQADSEEEDERENDIISRLRPRIQFLPVGVAVLILVAHQGEAQAPRGGSGVAVVAG